MGVIWGEDFVLTGTIPQSDWESFESQCQKEGIQITRIGQVKDDQAASVMLKDNDQQTMLMKKDIIILRNEVTSTVKLTWTTKGADETKRIAAALAKLVMPGDVLTLEGDLGAGKTTFQKVLRKA